MEDTEDMRRAHIIVKASMWRDLERIARETDRPVIRVIREALGSYIRERRAMKKAQQ